MVFSQLFSLQSEMLLPLEHPGQGKRPLMYKPVTKRAIPGRVQDCQTGERERKREREREGGRIIYVRKKSVTGN